MKILKTPLYYKIKDVPGADVSNVTATAGDVDTGKVFVNSSGTEVTGTSTYKADYTALNTLVGQTTAEAEDVAQGKVFVNSSGVQTTGTASGGASQDLINMIERPSNTTITVPDGVTTIGYRTFAYFHGLTGVTLPNTITTLLQFSFFDDMNLTTINLPEGITYIGARAFDSVGLTTVTLPSTLVNFGDPESSGSTSGGVFRYCTNLTTVTFLSRPLVNYFKSDTFQNCTNLTTIRVPWAQGAVSGAPWGATNATIVYNYT